MALSLLVAALALAAVCGGASSQEVAVQTFEMDEFSSVVSCLPYTINVGVGSEYAVHVNAVENVRTALNATVVDGTLFLETTEIVSMSNPVQLLVTLPSTELEAVYGFGTAGGISVTGFNSSSLKLVRGTMAGPLYAVGVTADEVTVQAAGLSAAAATGTIGSASVATQGASSVTLAGVHESVAVDISGISTIRVLSDSNASSISGTTSGPARVVYNQGSCRVTGFFFNSCVQEEDLAVELPALNWTQAITAFGNLTCASAFDLQDVNNDIALATGGVAIDVPRADEVDGISSAPAPEGEAPETETEAPAPEAEAPAPEAEAQAEQVVSVALPTFSQAVSSSPAAGNATVRVPTPSPEASSTASGAIGLLLNGTASATNSSVASSSIAGRR